MGGSGWKCSKESENSSIGQKGDGDYFLRDSQGVVLIEYLEKGKTITGQYYATLLDQLNDAIKAKCPHLAKKIALPP